MESTVELRSRGSQALGAGMMTVAALALVSAVRDGSGALLDYGAAVLLVGVLGYAAFWRPSVEVSDGGIVVHNTLRTVHVPWPAVEGVDGRYGLQLRTAYGSVTAWAAGAPAGKQRARGQDSSAATLVTERLQRLRAAGYLDDPQLEHARLQTTWHTGLIALIAVLAVAAVVLPLLG
jgi:hypothetical protein